MIHALAMTKANLGTSGWAYATWKPKFYPPEVKAAGFLRHYAERFRTVERNYTFNHLSTVKNIEAWSAAPPRSMLPGGTTRTMRPRPH